MLTNRDARHAKHAFCRLVWRVVNLGFIRSLLRRGSDEGIGCIVFSPLAQGMLTDCYLDDIPADSRAAKPNIFLRREQITDAILDLARSW